MLDAIDWARRQPALAQIPAALFGTGTGAAAALERVEAPILLIVETAHASLTDMNRDAMHRMRAHVELEMAANARVASLTAGWCQRYLWSMA